MIAEVLTDVSEAEWRAFLAETPGANVFQSPDLMRVYGKTEGYRPNVVAVESGGRVRALMASAVVSYTSGRLSSLTARAIVVGGPLGEASFFPALLAANDQDAAKAALLTQIRNLRPPSDRTAFEAASYRWEDHLNYLIDLSQGEEVVLKGMSRSRQKGIARTERLGLEVRELRLADRDAAYALLVATYTRSGVPLAHRSLFEYALSELRPGDRLWVLAALHEGSPCAVRFVLRWDDTLFDWYAGSNNLSRSLRADEWLVWQVIRKGIEAGCRTFDFGGGGRPGEAYGPGEFKRQFGGIQINPGRFEKVHRPLTLRLSEIAYRAWRMLP